MLDSWALLAIESGGDSISRLHHPVTPAQTLAPNGATSRGWKSCSLRWKSAHETNTLGCAEHRVAASSSSGVLLQAAKFLMKMQLSDLGNRWFGENFIIPRLTATWVEHDIHNCCQTQLVAACCRERMRSSNWNGLQRGGDEGIRSDQISSILLAVCKQLLINNTVTVWRQMTPRLPKTRPRSQPRGGKAAWCERTHIWLHTEWHKLTRIQLWILEHHLNSEEGNLFFFLSLKGKFIFVTLRSGFVVMASISVGYDNTGVSKRLRSGNACLSLERNLAGK